MLGADLCAQLRGEYDLCGIDMVASNKNNEAFEICDITDNNQIEEVFQLFKPQIVIHAAAYTNVDGAQKYPDKAELINKQGTKNVVYACKKLNAKIVYISTDYVFNGKQNVPYLDTDSPCPINKYGESKLLGEIYVRESAVDYLIVRTSWLFGKNGNNFVQTILGRKNQLDPLYVVNDQRGAPTYTVSLAKAIDALLSSVFFRSDNRPLAHACCV